jgi:hypothetical protein
MKNLAVPLAHGSGWDTARPIRSQDGWDEHAAFMNGLAEVGPLVVGAPSLSSDSTSSSRTDPPDISRAARNFPPSPPAWRPAHYRTLR